MPHDYRTTEFLYEQTQAASRALYFLRDMIFGFSAVVLACAFMPFFVFAMLISIIGKRRKR